MVWITNDGTWLKQCWKISKCIEKDQRRRWKQNVKDQEVNCQGANKLQIVD